MSTPATEHGDDAGARDLWRGLYVGLVVNLAFLAVLNNNPASPPSAGAWLVTLGTANELLGVLFVASPELEPFVRRALSWAARRWRQLSRWAIDLVKRVTGLPRHRTVRASAAGAIAGGGRVRARVTRNPPANATRDELVAWLVEQDAAHQKRFSDIEDRLSDLPEEWTRDIEEVRADLEGVSQTLIRASAERRIRLRLLGVGYVVFGLILSWVGNVL